MDIVIDKSYLEGAQTEEVLRLCQENKVLMPESLFYELLTTTPKKRVNCFRKLPDKKDPVVLIPNVGTLMRFEINNKLPCNPVTQLAIGGGGKFNINLRNEDYCLPVEKISQWMEKIRKEIIEFKECSAIVYHWFPSLAQYRTGQQSSTISTIEDVIAKDENRIREIYEEIREPSFPARDMIGPDWILFRRMQVHLLAAVDYIRRFGLNNTSAKIASIENDFLDIEYCITGVQVGALACRDNRMREMFNKLCPNGLLIEGIDELAAGEGARPTR
jgi:hypothetical protein